MRLLSIALSLALLPAATVHARWDDREAGLPIVHMAPLHHTADPTLFAPVVDARGRLYCAAERIYEYNGLTWSSIEASNRNIILTLAIDDTNRLWCGGVNNLGYVDEDATGLRTFQSLRAYLPEEYESFTVWKVHRLQGKTLFVSNHALFVWDGTRFEVTDLPVPRRLYSFEFGGSVHVSQPQTGLWRWDGTGLIPVTLGGFERDVVQAAWTDAAGLPVFLAVDSLVRLHEDRAESFAAATIQNIRPHLISDVTLLPDGTVAFLTVTGGVFIIDRDGTELRRIGREDGLSSLYAANMTVDANGIAWLAGGEGVARMDTRHRQSIFSTRNGVGGEGIRVIDTPHGDVLALSNEGVGRLSITGSVAARFENLPFLLGKYLDLTTLPDHGVVVTGMREFLRVGTAGAESLLETSNDIFHVVPLGTNPPRYAAAEGDTIALLDFSRPDPRESVITDFPASALRLAPDARGTLWAAFFRDGIIAIDHIHAPDPTKRSFTAGTNLPDPFDNPGLLVLGGDAYAFTPDAIVALPSTPGASPRVVLPGVGLLAAEQSGVDSLWAVASTPGREPRVVRVTRGTDGQLTLRTTDQVIRDIGYVTSLSRTQDHILWIGGHAGFVRIDSRAIGDEPALQAPIIQSVSWHVGEATSRLPLADAPTVAFARTGSIDLQLRDRHDPFAPTQLIETRLVGTDKGWRLTGKSRSIDGLDEGRYTLEARTVSFLGTPGPVETYRFTIKPPWFRTPLAYLGYVVAFGGSLTLAAQWRTRRIRHQNAQLEQLVNRRTEELAQAVSARSAFLANMGHEIRNPLNGVVGLVDALRSRVLAPEQKGIVDRIGTCADQLISVIDDVLEYARIDAGRIALRTLPFVVREPVDAAIDIFRAARPDAEIILEAEPAGLDEQIVGDANRVRHILVNYLANALKFGGGTPVTVTVRRDGALLVLAVTDRGPGISTEEQVRLFVRFSRGSLAYKNAVPGTGLGLAACRAYAEAMGGDVSVESEPGHGATFFLRIPFRPASADVAPATTASPDILVGRKALVVDDQDFNRFVLTDLLGRMGATTTQASSIGEAQDAFRAHVPDIVFVDFDLAGATGADLAEWIRKEAPAGRDVPIVATTAFEVDEVRRRCDEAAMDGFLAKPVTAQRLVDVVAHIESVRSGGATPVVPLKAEPETLAASSFLDILAGGDPERRKELARSTWLEVLTEALAAHRALRREDSTLTARHAHRLVSAALILGHRAIVTTARELNAVAKAGDLASAREVAARLRHHIRTARKSDRG